MKPESGNLKMNTEVLEETLRESLSEIRYIQQAIADKNYSFAISRLEDLHNDFYEAWKDVSLSMKGGGK